MAYRSRRVRPGRKPSATPISGRPDESDLLPRRTKTVHHLVAAALLTLLVAFAYSNTLGNDFVWDDADQILHNPSVSAGAPWLPLFSSDVWAFQHPGQGSRNNYYRPLQMLTYRVTAQLFGFNARSFHLVNLIFHLLATLLAYAVFYQLTRRLALAVAAAALFAIHPIHTEVVAWVSALTELGCAVFFLLAFYLFLLARGDPAGGTGQDGEGRFRRRKFWVASWVCFALALLWKEMAVTLPIVIASYIVFCSREPSSVVARLRAALRVTLPYWGVVAAYLPLRYHALGFLYISQRNWVLSPSNYALTVIHLVANYWWKLLLPVHLNAYYVFDPIRSWAEPRALAAMLFLLLGLAGIVYGFRRAPLASFAATWVFLTLLPVLNLRAVGRNVFAERYLYIPSVGFCLLLIWLANKGLTLLPAGYRSWAGACALGLLVVFYLSQTLERNADWRDDFTFFSRTVEASPDSSIMQDNLAELLRQERGDLAGAEQHYLRAIALAEMRNPPEWDQIDSAYVGLAIIYLDRQQYEKALGALDKAQAANPSDAGIQTTRGAILLQAGRWEEARNMLREALKTNSNDENALNALGTIAWQHEQHYDQAIDYFQQALRVHPAADSFNSSLHNSLGAVYCESGRCSEAIPHFQRAIELAPSDPEYHTNLGNAFGFMGRLAEARAQLERALALAPDYAPARASLEHLEEVERGAR